MNKETIMHQLRRLRIGLADLADSVQSTVESSLAALAARVLKLEETWENMYPLYDYEAVTPADTSTKPYTYTETLKDGDTVKATKVTTCNANGTYTEVITIGSKVVTRTYSNSSNTWTGDRSES